MDPGRANPLCRPLGSGAKQAIDNHGARRQRLWRQFIAGNQHQHRLRHLRRPIPAITLQLFDRHGRTNRHRQIQLRGGQLGDHPGIAAIVALARQQSQAPPVHRLQPRQQIDQHGENALARPFHQTDSRDPGLDHLIVQFTHHGRSNAFHRQFLHARKQQLLQYTLAGKR